MIKLLEWLLYFSFCDKVYTDTKVLGVNFDKCVVGVKILEEKTPIKVAREYVDETYINMFIQKKEVSIKVWYQEGRRGKFRAGLAR